MIVSEVDYRKMLRRIFDPIEAERGVSITYYSLSAQQQGHYQSGHLTYDCDSSFQVTVCIWLDPQRKHCRPVESPTPIVSPQEEAAFEIRLRDTVATLIDQASSHK